MESPVPGTGTDVGAKVLMVGRTRYRFPLSPALHRKFSALDTRLDVHVLAAAATTGDAAAADAETFELVPPRKPRRLDGPLFYLELPFRVARHLRRFEPDAVVAQSPYEAVGIYAGRALVRQSPTVVVEVHGDFHTATRLYGSRARKLLSPIADLAARMALRRADRVRTVGPFTSDVVRAYGVEPAASFPAFTDRSTLAAKPPAPPPAAPSFLFVGVLERYKNVDSLAEAWRRVARWEPRSTLRIVGDGSERSTVERLVAELPGQTAWNRRLTNGAVAAALDRSTALLLPSRSEGLPRIAIEALERGRPVIGARAGGIPDIVQDGVNGILVAPDSIPALSEAMLSIADEPDLAARLAAGARRTAGRCSLSPDEYARRVQSLVA
jgi:glycosyltransferase involved in cell wall biosynthesis